MIELIAAAVLVMCASLIGVVSVWRQAGERIERNLHFLISFSAGVFLVIAYHLATETIGHAGSLREGMTWIFAGALGTWVLFKFLPALHAHHGHRESGIDTRRLILSDGFHNFGDGIVLAAAFTASSALGAVAAASIFVHELVQEVSEFFVLRAGGYSTKRALALNFAVSSPILIGAVGGYFLLDSFEVLEVPLLGIAAGAFLVVVLHDLIPHSVRDSIARSHHVRHVAWFLIGALLMAGVSALLPHVEEGEGPLFAAGLHQG